MQLNRKKLLFVSLKNVHTNLKLPFLFFKKTRAQDNRAGPERLVRLTSTGSQMDSWLECERPACELPSSLSDTVTIRAVVLELTLCSAATRDRETWSCLLQHM